MYVLKQQPEDFIVKEMFEPKLGGGRYGCYLLWKRSYTTEKAMQTLSRKLRIRPKYFNASGNKDKYAVTEQFITISRGPKRDVEMNDIRLTYLGQTSDRMNMGTASGNSFEIVVRGLGKEKPEPVKMFPNYFDEQRFGRNLNNHEVGKLIIRKDFEGACSMVPETRERLKQCPTDFVGALRSLPKGILRMFPNSYQSWLWNETVSSFISGLPHREIEYPLGRLAVQEEAAEKGMRNMEVPVLGYESGIPENLKGIIGDLVGSQGIALRDFRVSQIPELDLRGDVRRMMVEPGGLKVGRKEDDELNPGKKKVRISFSLPNGSYATMLVRCMFTQP